jgi:hypothetical protein
MMKRQVTKKATAMKMHGLSECLAPFSDQNERTHRDDPVSEDSDAMDEDEPAPKPKDDLSQYNLDDYDDDGPTAGLLAVLRPY